MARHSVHGFTLIELMVVILILGLLAGVAWHYAAGSVPPAKWESARTEMMEIHKALSQWSMENGGDYPETLADAKDKFPGRRVPKDPFTDAPYEYERTETGFTLTCLGMDKAQGGDGKENRDILFDETGQVAPED
jgi:general secretion pathway protein G